MSAPRRMLAEMIGTFFFCFAGIGAYLSTLSPINSGIGWVGVAMAASLALSVAVCTFGGISGAHFNPAVTIGMLFTGRIRLDGAVLYILAQIAGACLAAWACYSIWPAEAVTLGQLGVTLPPAENMPGVEGSWLTTAGLFLCEFIATFLLMIAIFGVAIDERGQVVTIGAFAIGLTVAFIILTIGPITGASMNPARSLGPALVYKLIGGEGSDAIFDLHWCYWAAPVAGAVLAAVIYDGLLLSDDE